MFIGGSGYRYDKDIAVLCIVNIGAEHETAVEGGLQFGVFDFEGGIATRLKLLNALGIDVDTDYFVFLGKGNGKGESDVAEADNCNS